MYIAVICVILFVFLAKSLVKMYKGKDEWFTWLIMLSFIKTCISYLFLGTTVFTVVSVGGIQVHIDDIVMLVLFFYVVSQCINIKLSQILSMMALVVIPIIVSMFRGVLYGYAGSPFFLNDVRKFVLFLVAMIAGYFCYRTDSTGSLARNSGVIIHRLMNIVLICVFIVWSLDVAGIMRGLPGQHNGLLSDGGSTFRIINPPQVLMIALYTLHCLHSDLQRYKLIKIRTILFLLVVILMQWRTVVASSAVGILIVFAYHIKKGNLFSWKLIAEIFAIVVLGALIITQFDLSYFTDMVDNLFNSFSSVKNNEGTFSTRQYVWSLLLNSLSGINKFIGKPFGSPNTTDWQASAHSGYVDYIMVTGYFGVIFLVIFMLYLLVVSIRRRKAIITAFVCVIMVYWYGYGFSVEQAALLGACTAYVSTKKGVIRGKR